MSERRIKGKYVENQAQEDLKEELCEKLRSFMESILIFIGCHAQKLFLSGPIYSRFFSHFRIILVSNSIPILSR